MRDALDKALEPTIPSEPGRKTARRWVGLGCFLLIVAISGFYRWTALPLARGAAIVADSRDYYNLLARGFLKGHTWLDAEVDPSLATMKDVFDPVERAGRGLHDASYYKGKYYLYFGPTPEILLFIPFKLISGRYISESCASLIFSIEGMLGSLLLLACIRRKYFSTLSPFFSILIVLILGCSTMVPVILRRASVWEVPITCAYACFMLGLVLLFKGFHSDKKSGLFFALGSLCFGLAVASRPVYLFGCAALALPPLFRCAASGGILKCWRDAEWRRTLLGCFIPVCFIGLSLAVYNYVRFESFSEFGQRYQMAGAEVSKLKLFDWSYPWYGFRIYILEPAGRNHYFPFFSVITPPLGPPGHLGVENPYGVLPNMPVSVLSIGILFLLCRSSQRRQYRPILQFCACAAVGVLLTMVTVMSFGGLTNRYMVDFVPGLMVFASIGMLSFFVQPWAVGFKRILLLVVICGLTLYSALFNILVSLQHNEQMRAEQPALYKRVAHAANYVNYYWDRITGVRYGPIELKVIFPKGEAGQIQCLIATGTSFRADYIYVHYLSDDSVRFGFEHTSRGGMIGKPIHFTPGEIQTLKIDLGSFYPPEAHPYFDHLPKEQAWVLQKTTRVTMNGDVALEGIKECYDATSVHPSIGTSDGRPGFTNNFSGQVLSWRRDTEDMPQPPKVSYGPIRLMLKFPAFAGDRTEPLVCSGETGKGDLVFVRYIDEHHILFGHDNWGGGGRMGSPIEVDYTKDHVIEVDYGSLYPAANSPGWNGPVNRERIIIKLDGQVAMDQQAPFHLSPPEEVMVGVNSIQASSSYPVFTGNIVRTERGPRPTPALNPALKK